MTPTLLFTVAKRDDPISSYLAGEQAHRSGRAATQREQVLCWLQLHGPATGAEIGMGINGDRYSGHRRLCELERLGLVQRAGCHRCQVTRRKCQVWRAVLPERTLFDPPEF